MMKHMFKKIFEKTLLTTGLSLHAEPVVHPYALAFNNILTRVFAKDSKYSKVWGGGPDITLAHLDMRHVQPVSLILVGMSH